MKTDNIITKALKDTIDTVNTAAGCLFATCVVGPLYLGKIIVDDIVNIHLKK